MWKDPPNAPFPEQLRELGFTDWGDVYKYVRELVQLVLTRWPLRGFELQEIAVEVWIATKNAFRQGGTYRQPAESDRGTSSTEILQKNFRNYVLGMIKNHILQRCRALATLHRHKHAYGLHSDHATIDALTKLVQEEQQRIKQTIFESMMRSLSERDRELLELRLHTPMTYDALADLLDDTSEALRSRYSRILKQLAERFPNPEIQE